METLIIHGCGGHARSVAAAVKNHWNIVFIDPAARIDETIFGFPVYTALENAAGFEHCAHHIAIGALDEKRALFEQLKSRGCVFPPLVAPRAVIMDEAVLGEGVFIGVGAYIGPRAKIGENTIVNTHAIVEHDAQIGANAHISIGAVVAGYSKVGDNTMIGAGATVVDKIIVGSDIVIGAGAVVCKSIIESGIYVGVPAMHLKK